MRFLFSLATVITLITIFQESEQAVRPVTLFIRLFDVKGKRSTILDEGYKYTVGELKNMLLKEMDVSGHILRLYFEGQELWIPDRTLASYRVRPGDTVDIYLENIAEQLSIRFGNQDKSPDGQELWIPDRTLASYRVRPGDTVDIYLENIAEQLAIRFGNQDKSPDGRLAE